ncbi:MAG: hypothetical protein KA524_04885 [Nitrosomonas sp.]|nr:hypothetical protein [Nitrosomonas sp.]MBP6076073.1 hypothetical protein [Nitrosomonas sp.]
MAISSEQNILQIVIGLFNATPGKNNLNDLTTAVNNGMTIPQLADFLDSLPIFTNDVMGDKTTTADKVGELLSHFGLVAGGAAGSADKLAEDFFTAQIDAGVSFGSIINQAVDFLNQTTDPAFSAVVTLLNNKVMVAQAFSESYSNNNLGVLQGVLGDVTGTAAYTDTDVDAVLLAAGYPRGGSEGTFILTNGTDIESASVFTSGLVYTPGGNDRINSLQDEDVLTGIGTDAKLNVTVGNAEDNGSDIITPTLNNIATLDAAFTGSGFGVEALDMQDATGLRSINITRVTQAEDRAEIGNIQDATVNDLSVSNTNANQDGTVEFSYGENVLLDENTVALEVSDVQLGFLNIGQNTSGIIFNGVGEQGYEIMTLNSAGGGSNTIGTLNMPMDTGTAGSLTITGNTDLRLGDVQNAVNVDNNTLVEVKDLYVVGSGIAQAGSRIATINAEQFTGNLTLVLDNILDVGKADTSGVDQDVTVTGGSGGDTFVLYDEVQSGDSINGGEGDDTLLFYSGSSLDSAAVGIENANLYADGSIGEIVVDFDNLADVTDVTLRNISSDVDQGGFGGDGVLENAADNPVFFELANLTDAQATGITLLHATTGNNQIENTNILASVKADTANNTLGITLEDGNNTDPRSNFTLVTAITDVTSTIENVTLTDSDTESNSVELNNFADHTGTITLVGGEAGDFINLDVNTDTANADISAVLNGGNSTLGFTADDGEVQQGLYGLDTDGGEGDRTAGHIFDVADLETQVRLGAATIDASAEAANVILRVSTNAASAAGAQTILMGSGDDTVIFDRINDSRAGLTISDTVTGGEGSDTLAIDGHGSRISLGASEWTNVSQFETLRLVGTNIAEVDSDVLLGQNSYNLALTNDLISSNGSGLLHIINDNDANNDRSGTATLNYLDTDDTGEESGVTIDARTLNAQNHFTYNGEEGLSNTIDRFMFSDANVNGGNTIDGGAVDNLSDTNGVNTDIMEIRNIATVTVGDLAGVSNIGTIAGVNDQAVEQILDLELNDTVIDALSDSYHAASTIEVETITVRLNALDDIAAPVAGMGLKLDAGAMTAKSAAVVDLDAAFVVADILKIGQGLLTVNNFLIADDQLQLSVSRFGLTLDDDDIGTIALTDTDGDLSNIIFGVAAVAATDFIIVDNTGADTNVYFDSDGNGAGTQVLIATIVGSVLVAADVDIIA